MRTLLALLDVVPDLTPAPESHATLVAGCTIAAGVFLWLLLYLPARRRP